VSDYIAERLGRGSDRRNTDSPSSPAKVLIPMSETTNHWVARASQFSLLSPSGVARHAHRPRLAFGQQAVDRNAGHHLAVLLHGDVDRALPDRRADILGDRIERVAIELPQEVGAGEICDNPRSPTRYSFRSAEGALIVTSGMPSRDFAGRTKFDPVNRADGARSRT
jgi:hypothetical protein